MWRDNIVPRWSIFQLDISVAYHMIHQPKNTDAYNVYD